MPTQSDNRSQQAAANSQPPRREVLEVLRQTAQGESGQAPEELLEQRGRPWWKPQRRLREKQRDYVLSRIPNARLRELVEAAYECTTNGDMKVRWLRESKDYYSDIGWTGDDALSYKVWVQDKLRKSDLAKVLPGGREALPDIYEAMSEPWASIERLLEPRNYKQLLRHVVRHLDWYLDPTQKPKPPIWQISVTVSVLILGSCFIAGEVYDIEPLKSFGSFAYFLGVGIALWLSRELARYFAPHNANGLLLHSFYRARGKINAAELFYYLIESYTEIGEPPSEVDAELIFGDSG